MFKRIFLCIAVLFLGCTSAPKNSLKVIATPVPHAEILEFIKPDLRAQGIELQIVVSEDYNMPNRALANREADANFFQHIPFLDEQIRQFRYPIKSLAKVELEPMGAYSKKIRSFSELKENSVIAIPNDPTNEARALLLLEKQGVIGLDHSNNLQITTLNISHNPSRIQFIEVDAAMAARALEDVDLAVINTNYALEARLSPLRDALALEGKDSAYANILAVHVEDEARPEIQALREALTSAKVREFIAQKYKGAVLPAF